MNLQLGFFGLMSFFFSWQIFAHRDSFFSPVRGNERLLIQFWDFFFGLISIVLFGFEFLYNFCEYSVFGLFFGLISIILFGIGFLYKFCEYSMSLRFFRFSPTKNRNFRVLVMLQLFSLFDGSQSCIFICLFSVGFVWNNKSCLLGFFADVILANFVVF